MLSKQEEQAERRRVMQNDQRVREQDQAGTFLSHTHSDAGGRFTQIGAAYVVGSTAVPQYPAASAPFQRDPVPDEPPLGYCIDAMPELELEQPSSFTAQATGEPTAPSSTIPLIDDVERVGSPLSQSGDPAGVHLASPPGTSRDVNAGSLPSRPHRRY
jgi:hypothetical protein